MITHPVDQSTLKELVTYNPETGKMFWKARTAKHINSSSALKSFNTRYAGNEIKTIDGKGYYHGSFGGKFLRVHRLAWLYVYGEMPKTIDHINGDRTDNRIVNLKSVTNQENHLNQRLNSTNTSGVAGVYLNKKSNRWCAQMKFNGKTYHLGSSKSFFETVCLRKSEERRLGFSLNHGVRK
tara:strand:- start:1864 stop:2406 length:543 start_codon:yes stop_codon:yes gene_type:complete